ncbi:MAG: hypothetical protein WC238_06425 [Parcubacteria group bacterium]|jgi:hypothetical protein
MMVNKRFIYLAVFVSILTIAGSATAVEITNPLAVDTIPELLMRIASYVGGFVAILGTIMIIISGILFLLSAGSPEKIGTAKKALVYAIIGIAVGLSATVISEIILNVIGGGTL